MTNIKLTVGQILNATTHGKTYTVIDVFPNSAVLQDRLENVAIWSFNEIERYFMISQETWTPQEGEKYWKLYLEDGDLRTVDDKWYAAAEDIDSVEIKNAFPTIELAEQALEVVKKALQEFNK